MIVVVAICTLTLAGTITAVGVPWRAVATGQKPAATTSVYPRKRKLDNWYSLGFWSFPCKTLYIYLPILSVTSCRFFSSCLGTALRSVLLPCKIRIPVSIHQRSILFTRRQFETIAVPIHTYHWERINTGSIGVTLLSAGLIWLGSALW